MTNSYPDLLKIAFFFASLTYSAIPPLMGSNSSNSNLLQPETQETNSLLDMRKKYHKGFEFPNWVIGLSKSPNYTTICQEARVYTTAQSEDEQEVINLLTQREPCNMSMEKKFDQNALSKTFKWKEAYYIDYFNKNKKLAPQVVVYCKTPVYKFKEGVTKYKKRYDSDKFEPNNYHNLHIINGIGAAFDDKKQPDYQYFLTKGRITQAKKNELFRFYINMWRLGFTCITQLDTKFTRMLIAGIGTDNFASKYPGNRQALLKEVWIPALIFALEEKADALKKAGIKEIGFLGDTELPTSVQKVITETLKCKYERYGRIPDMFLDQGKLSDEEELAQTIFWNAGDNCSMAGNGNRLDWSLNGFWGRISAICAFCWPRSNPELAKNISYITPETNATLPASPPSLDVAWSHYFPVIMMLLCIVKILFPSPKKKKNKDTHPNTETSKKKKRPRKDHT